MLERLKNLLQQIFLLPVPCCQLITKFDNREIGGVAPSKYLERIENKGQVNKVVLDEYLESHWIHVDSCRNNDFHKHIAYRAKMLLDSIENVTGKSISGRESEDVINLFGEALN